MGITCVRLDGKICNNDTRDEKEEKFYYIVKKKVNYFFLYKFIFRVINMKTKIQFFIKNLIIMKKNYIIIYKNYIALIQKQKFMKMEMLKLLK